MKGDELIILDNSLSETEVIRNQLIYKGSISREYYDGVLKATGCILESFAEAVTKLMGEEKRLYSN
jgi:hypothetical protein